MSVYLLSQSMKIKKSLDQEGRSYHDMWNKEFKHLQFEKGTTSAIQKEKKSDVNRQQKPQLLPEVTKDPESKVSDGIYLGAIRVIQ